MEFDLHPAPDVFGGTMLWPSTQQRRVLETFSEVTAHAPEELTVWFDLLYYPGTDPMVAVHTTYIGDPDTARALLRPFEQIEQLIADDRRTMQVGPQSYAESPANLGSLGHPENRDSHEKPYGRMVHHRITQGQHDCENSVGFLSGRARSASILITRFIADHQGHRDSPDSRYGDGLMAFLDETADISSDGHARPAFPPRC